MIDMHRTPDEESLERQRRYVALDHATRLYAERPAALIVQEAKVFEQYLAGGMDSP